jgi:hypothetical protein
VKDPIDTTTTTTPITCTAFSLQLQYNCTRRSSHKPKQPTKSFTKSTMKTFLASITALVAVSAASAFSPTPSNNHHQISRVSSLNAEAAAAESVPLANGRMSFNRVCREWRCKYEGDKGTSESLEVCSGYLETQRPCRRRWPRWCFPRSC